MKIGIVTHYSVHNHGAMLQLFALICQLKEIGHEAKALQYKKNFDFMTSSADLKNNLSVKSIPYYLDYMRKKGIKRTIYNVKKWKMLSKFRSDNNVIGDFYSKAENLDAVIIGSDEIFSIEPGLNPCFWGMGIPCKNIISYAGSFGPTSMQFIKDHNSESFIEAGIKNIKYISVRDRNSASIIESLSGRTANIVCDPVLLYNLKQHGYSIKPKSKHYVKGRYCIVYSYDNDMNNEDTVSAIRQYSKENNLKVLSIGYYHQWCDHNIEADPLELYDWFENAVMVFTDTFHGTVLSIVNSTQFITHVHTNANKLGFLLEQYGLVDRRVESFREIHDKKEIDYEIVQKRVESIRNESLHFLKQSLGELKND